MYVNYYTFYTPGVLILMTSGYLMLFINPLPVIDALRRHKRITVVC